MREMEQKENPIMRADEVIKILGIGRNTLYEWCRKGLIPHIRIGRLIFFSRKVIMSLFGNHKIGGRT